MQAPIMSGTTVKDGEFVKSYPINLEARAMDSGVSKGQLVTTRGTKPFGTGPGKDRGGIVWNGMHYRVMGSKLVSVSATGAVTTLADVGDDASLAGLDYGFGRLAIRSSQRLFYWDGTTLTDVTDPDLGVVLDMLWMDGYYVTTDGTYVVLTDLSDPTSVDPLRYGSAEEDPDPITGLLKYREELYVIGRNTIQVMQNTGGNGFPFSVANGAMIPTGAVSASAKCMVGGDGFAFVGSPRNEPIAVYYYNGSLNRLSDTEIDDILAEEAQPELIQVECRAFSGERQILVHLAGKTLMVPLATSDAAGAATWSILHSGYFEPYRPRRAVFANGVHVVGDAASNALGVLSERESEHFGIATDWQFDSALMFDAGGMHLSQVELTGQFPTVKNAIFCSITRDGVQWSREVSRVLSGRRDERVLWNPNVDLYAMGAFRFRGRSKVAISSCEIT